MNEPPGRCCRHGQPRGPRPLGAAALQPGKKPPPARVPSRAAGNGRIKFPREEFGDTANIADISPEYVGSPILSSVWNENFAAKSRNVPPKIPLVLPC